ncbi:cyclic nucleotide-binding domain-containing protein [Ferrovibrio sp.]|uniref:cyclic nucleotide-binding domain-containing protein n=1 Tax=Ferrovibrio sp. TaxID=1917215 RepID=UPI002624490A|nr:cyclic nucleotide-binding domain-containing protein [Ferrovibrio sp.]
MSLNEEVELLRRIPLFAKIEASKLKLLAFTSQRLTYKPGDVLFHQGDPGDAAFVIIGGEADVMVDAPGGQLKVAHLKQNDFVGEIAILCDVPRTATVIAATEVTTLRIEKDLFFRLIADFPQIAIEIMRVLAQRLERTTTDLRTLSAKLKS